MIRYEENNMDLKRAKHLYDKQKWQAKQRNIEWLFTFDSWVKKWEDSNKWEQRGIKRGQYQMCRFKDMGPYSPDNVIIKTQGENLQDAHLGKIKTEIHKQKISLTKKGNKNSLLHNQKVSKSITEWWKKRKAA